MYKQDLTLNNLQWLICHKIQPKQIIYIQYICIKKIWHCIIHNGSYTIKSNQTIKKNQLLFDEILLFYGWLDNFFLQYINPCWVILCQNQLNSYLFLITDHNIMPLKHYMLKKYVCCPREN